MEICRICRLNKEKDELVANLNHKIKNMTFKDYFERFSRTRYSDDKGLPQKICATCHAEIKLFILKAESWNRNEAGYSRSKRKHSENTGNDDDRKKEEAAKKPKKDESTAFMEIRKLFELEKDLDPLKDFENFPRVDVDHSNLEKDGEISRKWLERVADKKVWGEMVFDCDCERQVTSLVEYISHLKKDHGSICKIKCPENCNNIFNSISSFINHTVATHKYDYLCYCCIVCSKLYYNIPALISHYEAQHSNVKNLYMCIECGTYCQSLELLNQHKLTIHHPTDEDKSDIEEQVEDEVTNDKKEFLVETDISFFTPSKKKPGRPKSELSKTLPSNNAVAVKSYVNLNKTSRIYHPKTHNFDESSNRTTFPCSFEGCSRILLSKQGYDYHILVHSGEKPFKCNYCNKSYRSKQIKDYHMRSMHEEYY